MPDGENLQPCGFILGPKLIIIRLSLWQNSKNTLRQAQGERYLDYSIHGEPVEPPFPFVVSLSNHNSYFCKRLTSVQLFGMNNHKEKKQKEIRLMPDAEVGPLVARRQQV